MSAIETISFLVDPIKKIIFGDEQSQLSSLPVAAWKEIHQKYSISDYIPYSSYDSETSLFHHNDGNVAFCCEVTPRSRSGGASAVAMNEILSKMPDGVFLQTTYFGSKNLERELKIFREEHSVREQMGGIDAELVGESMDQMIDFLRQKTKESCSETMVTKVKNIRLFFSIVSNTKSGIKNIEYFKQDLVNVLHSNGFDPRTVEAKDLFEIGYELMNPDQEFTTYPDYDDTHYLNKQVVSPNSTYLVDDDFIQINNKTTWVNLTPQSISKNFHIWEFGQKLGDYMGDSLNANQFNDSFLINLTVKKKSKKATSATTRNHATISSQNWGAIFRKFTAVKEESLDIIDRIDEKKEELYEFDMDVLISGENKEAANANAQVIESYWNKSGEGLSKIKLDKTKGIHHLAFLNALPMAVSEEYFTEIGGKFRTLFSNQISHFFPLEADSRGEGFNLPLVTRRGGLGFIDLYSSNTNFNGFIVATSGAGKSVLLNMLGYNSYARGDKVFVLDYDNSFTGLTESIDGQYLELNPDIKSISFNPFSEISSVEELRAELPYLSAFIYLLGSSKSTQRAEEDEKLIKTEMQQIILNQYTLLQDKLEITYIRDAIIKEHSGDSRFTDFAKQLGQYCKNGMYEKWFSGPCEFTMEKDMMAVEFKGVEAHDDLRDPLIMLLLYHIGKVMYSPDPNKPRIQIILDEAHRFLGKNPRMDDFIEQAYRRARKFNASMIIATQGFDDIAGSDGLNNAGRVIINNSAWKLFLKQTEPSTNAMIKSEVFGFDETDKKLLRSVKTKKREYSEIFTISSDDRKTIFRLIMPKFFYYLTTTDQQDKKLLNQYMETYQCNKIKAIRILLDEQNNKK